MRVIIACAGSQHKWGAHLGVPSHLVPVGGEPLLHRTVRQAATLTGDVHLTSPADDRYAIDTTLNPGEGVVRHIRHIRDGSGSEYTSTRALWNEHGRTVLLLGDVYFTDVAIDVIRGCTVRDYRVFGRAGASTITGTPYGEIFAASWWPQQHTILDRHLKRVGGMTKAGWRLLRCMQGTSLNRHIVHRRYFVTIDDLTDDLDAPADYDRHPVFAGGRG